MIYAGFGLCIGVCLASIFWIRRMNAFCANHHEDEARRLFLICMIYKIPHQEVIQLLSAYKDSRLLVGEELR